jgi:hypothetical protein
VTAQLRRAARLEEPVRADRASTSPSPIVVGRIRLPITVTHRPWATLYRTPTGATYWSVRLWVVDRPVETWVATSTLRDYVLQSGLRSVANAVEDLLSRADEVDAGG